MFRLDKGSLRTLKEIFQRNGHPASFIDKCFKKFFR